MGYWRPKNVNGHEDKSTVDARRIGGLSAGSAQGACDHPPHLARNSAPFTPRIGAGRVESDSQGR